jgi:lactate dehydrogenase-like 2-hydroxyacid dehydrogenase
MGPLKDASGQMIKEPELIAKELNKCFSDVFTREEVNDLPRARQHAMRMRPTNTFITAHTGRFNKKLRS